MSETKHTPEIEIKVNNPYPFLLGEINAHVDRVLRDKGAATADVSNAVMTAPQPGFFTTWINTYHTLLERNQQLEQQTKTLRETLQSIQRHGLIEKDGYESVLQSLHAALALTDPTLKQYTNGN